MKIVTFFINISFIDFRDSLNAVELKLISTRVPHCAPLNWSPISFSRNQDSKFYPQLTPRHQVSFEICCFRGLI